MITTAEAEFSSMLKIVDALPQIFKRAYPTIDPRTETLSALSLLRFHEIDALPVLPDSRLKHRAVFGFSCLARLMQLKPKQFTPFLEQPCESASEPIATVQASQALSSLLDAFARTRFGFARVEKRRDVGALVGLPDVLGLFGDGKVSSRLSVKSVASPIFSISKDATLGKALQEMFGRRCRRLFIDGTSEFIWDRGIIGYIFSPESLSSAATGRSADILRTPVAELETSTAKEVSPKTSLRSAAGILLAERGRCLVFDENVVTPWDVVMKPWKARALKLS